MKKIILCGPATSFFAQVLFEKAQMKEPEIELVIVEDETKLGSQLVELNSVTVIFVNKSENEVQKIKNQHPQLVIIMCHGGTGDSQPFVTWVDVEKNHQDFWFENQDEFFEIIKNPPLREKLLFSALPEEGLYRVNYENLPELTQKKNETLDPKIFWFSLYFSKIYLAWFKKWLKEVNQLSFSWSLKAGSQGKQKKITIPFNNQHLDELIFREGGDVVFGNSMGTGKCWPVRQRTLVAKVISADGDGIEVEFNSPVPNSHFDQVNCFCRGGDILSLMVATYSKNLKNYSDFRLDGFPLPLDEYYSSPEAYLRGYVANNNQYSQSINEISLNAKAKRILRDNSQSEALMNILDSSFVSVVQGPPGAGKTFLTAVAVKQFVLCGNVVLVTAHSNQGLDNLLQAISEHVDNNLIFRLGNSTELISQKSMKWHRQKRYQKLIAKEGRALNKNSLVKSKEVSCECEDIWAKICSGKGVVLAVTVNSFEFDDTIKYLSYQNGLVANIDFEKDNIDIGDMPHAVKKFMLGSRGKARPSASFSVGIIDEATKGLPFEIFSIAREIATKLILIGDTNQLGNIPIQNEIRREVFRYILDRLHFDRKIKKMILYPNTNKTKGLLMEMSINLDEVEKWFNNFSEGIFFCLSSYASQLSINRRSLPEIVKFINFVFEQKLKIGRFSSQTAGQVTFLDVRGLGEKRVKTSYRNLSEAAIIAKEIMNFFKKQKKEKGEVSLDSLGVIAMYRSQVTAIKERVRNDLIFHPIFSGLVTPENIEFVLNRMVNTVDAFQGSEREMIIISLVRSNQDRQTGFSSNRRRFYVALTRARNKVIVAGNSPTFLAEDENGTFKRIMEYTRSRNTYSVKKIK